MAYFPMMVDLDGKPVLVIGGGKEGLKKVEVLHAFGASVTLIATDAEEKAVSLSDRFFHREFEDSDIYEQAYVMIVAATDDRELNRRISGLSRKEHIPVNIVDDQELCSFIFPAIIQEKNVVCAVSSGGKSPYVAQYVRDKLREVLPENIGEINEAMGTYRTEAKAKYSDADDRRRFLRERFNELTEKKDGF